MKFKVLFTICHGSGYRCIRITFWKQDPDADPHQSEKPDPDPLQRRIRICIKVKIQEPRRLKMDALEGRGRSQWRRGASKWSRVRSVPVCQWLQIRNTWMRNRIRIRVSANGRIRIRIKVKSWIRIRIKVKGLIWILSGRSNLLRPPF